MPALVVLPFIAVTFFYYHYRLKGLNILIYIICFILPPLILTLPWFLTTWEYYGVLVKTGEMPESLIRNNKYVAMVTSRPVYYFFKELVLLCPLILFPFVWIIRKIKDADFIVISHWLWFFSMLGGITVVNLMFERGTYVMRYITPMILPMYFLIGIYFFKDFNEEKMNLQTRYFNYVIIILALCFNIMTSFFYIVQLLFIILFGLSFVIFRNQLF